MTLSAGGGYGQRGKVEGFFTPQKETVLKGPPSCSVNNHYIMKTNRTFKFPAAIILLGVVCAFASVTQAEDLLPANAVPKAKAPKITKEISYIGPATEQVVLTEKDKDGTVFRVVQILHQDGTSETSGERRAPIAKS
jgi:hypothetical protein